MSRKLAKNITTESGTSACLKPYHIEKTWGVGSLSHITAERTWLLRTCLHHFRQKDDPSGPNCRVVHEDEEDVFSEEILASEMSWNAFVDYVVLVIRELRRAEKAKRGPPTI